MLEYRDVCLRYPEGDRDAVSGFSLSIPEGRVLALLGPNGSGKSTLLLAALGWMRPRSGEVLLAGRAVSGWSPGERARKAAYLSQIERVSFTYEVLEFVLMGRAPHLAPLAEPDGREEGRARAALDALGIGDFARRHVTALSGGELQLVRLARCLVQEAPLVLLDEPTAALDPANALRVADALAALAREGRTVVFSTHDAALAAYAADSSVLIREGRLLAAGPAGEVLVPELLSRTFTVPFGISRAPSPFFTGSSTPGAPGGRGSGSWPR
jgi:iron complex transport system ATP-binding protein